MRFASFAALAAAFAVLASSPPASAGDYQRPRTHIVIQKRSFLDAGTTVKPGTARYTNYLIPVDPRIPTYGPPNDNLNTRWPLAGPYELPGY
jgi:hypothetical protein